jgi:hypothetical protein
VFIVEMDDIIFRNNTASEQVQKSRVHRCCMRITHLFAGWCSVAREHPGPWRVG